MTYKLKTIDGVSYLTADVSTKPKFPKWVEVQTQMWLKFILGVVIGALVMAWYGQVHASDYQTARDMAIQMFNAEMHK